MKHIRKGSPPQELIEYQKSTPDATYGGLHGDTKQVMRQTLTAEQQGICAYCMKGISADREKCTVEHYEPQKGEYARPERQLDYSNMLAVCTDGERRRGCSSIKGDAVLETLNPHQKSCERLLRFRKDGTAYGTQESVKADIQMLDLNQNTLIDRRRIVIDEARKRMERKAGKRKSWTKRQLEKEIKRWSNPIKTRKGTRLPPFCQAAICYLEDKLRGVRQRPE